MSSVPSPAAILRELAIYLDSQHGGSAGLVAGWSARVALRKSSHAVSGKSWDAYYFNPSGAKFRSHAAVAVHFGLRSAKASLRGQLDAPSDIDHVLWQGAAEQGWNVHISFDNHNKYTAPDGMKFQRKADARAWMPSKAIVKVRKVAAAAATAKKEKAQTLVIPSAKPPARDLEGMDAVRAVLADMKLQSYAAAFEDVGYDDLPWLLSLDEERLLALASQDVAMKPGHAHKFVSWLATSAARCRASASATPLIA